MMVESHAIVYNLQSENRYEVALIKDIECFNDPIKFSMTGFNLKTRAKSFVVNQDCTLGFERPSTRQGLTRAFAEIDLH